MSLKARYFTNCLEIIMLIRLLHGCLAVYQARSLEVLIILILPFGFYPDV